MMNSRICVCLCIFESGFQNAFPTYIYILMNLQTYTVKCSKTLVTARHFWREVPAESACVTCIIAIPTTSLAFGIFGRILVREGDRPCVNMCVCVCVCVRVCAYVCECIRFFFEYICGCMGVCVFSSSIRVYVCFVCAAWISEQRAFSLGIYVHVYVYLHVRIQIYVHTYTNIYIHTHEH